MRDAPNMHLDADGLRIGIVTSLYHEEITTRLRSGAVSAFVDAGDTHWGSINKMHVRKIKGG